jgi:thioredoxin reductase
VRDRPIGALGLGPGSVEHAHLLRQWSDDLIFFTHTYPLTLEERAGLEARGIMFVDGLVAELSVVDDRLHAVQLTDGRAIPRTAVFIRPLLHAHTDGITQSLGCELDEAGFVQVDGTGQTTAPGVWAAGNATNPRAQVITAAGEGSAAAIAINTDLVAEDTHNALHSAIATDESAATP